VPWLDVGGADRLNLDAMQTLTRHGYECTIVTTLRNDTGLRNHTAWLSRFTAVTPDVFCLHTFLNASDHPRFISHLIESRQIDTVFVSNSDLGYALLPYLRARHPSVGILDYTHSVETAHPDGGYPGKSAQAGSLIDVRMVNTEQLRDWMRVHGVAEDGIEVLRCAVDMETWRPSQETRAAVRARLHLPQRAVCVAFVGRMSAEKRPHLFAKIIAEVAQRGVDIVAFAVGDGPEMPRLRRAIRRYGLVDRVKILGQLSPEKVRETLQATDVLLLPSALEGLAIVLIEAMAVGVVPVAARVGGQHELVTLQAGFLIEHGTNELAEYAAAIERLARDEGMRMAMAGEARTRVEQGFDLDSFSRGLRDSIERASLIASVRRGGVVPHAAQLAHEAVALLAAQDALDARWIVSNNSPLHRGLRQARQMVIPMGSSRYDKYKLLRERLRGYTAGQASAT